MPIYRMVCRCGYDEEIHFTTFDEPDRDCPECGKKLERKFTAGGQIIDFRGNGWDSPYKIPTSKGKSGSKK